LFTSSISPNNLEYRAHIPAHALDVFEKYQLGLNVVSMEGRESKHIAIGRYSKNTNFTGRWEQIFRHEFVRLIWLREKGNYEIENIDYKQTYIPSRVSKGESCFCGFEMYPNQEKYCYWEVLCCYCSNQYRTKIEESVW
jgi:hypothetical protein